MVIGLKIGDVVSRISYDNDIPFRIVALDENVAILAGVYVRIIADSDISDLVLVDDDRSLELQREISEYKDTIVRTLNNRINHITGVILHYDSDSSYLSLCEDLYRSLGIYAKCILKREGDIHKDVVSDIRKYRPDIVVITGHDSYNKKDLKDMNSYRNSCSFVKAIVNIRSYYSKDDIIIFAGACGSFFEALIAAGANYASSVNRMNIEAYDPAIVAILAGITPINSIIDIKEIKKMSKLKENNIGGVESYGKMRLLVR